MQGSSYDQTNAFSFNLVPPKSKEEIVQLEERDNSILYSFLLVFFAMLIFFILSLVQTFVIDQRIKQNNTRIQEQEASFQAFDEIRRVNGELITKGELLEPVLERDIKLTELLDLGNNLVIDNPGVVITTYSRESTGEFVLNMTVPSYEQTSDLLTYLNELESVENVFIRSINLTNLNDYSTIISFSLTNL